jgi:general secretion pathway protein A
MERERWPALRYVDHCHLSRGAEFPVWLRHWNLVRDPFPSSGGPYVATPGHDEAVARLVHAIRTGERLVSLQGESGAGKTTVLARALSVVRSPGLRIASINSPVSGQAIAREFVRSLRLRSGKSDAWSDLADAVRLIRAQAARLVLAIDGAEVLEAQESTRHLAMLRHLDPIVTVVVTMPPDSVDPAGDPFPVPLSPLTRGEASQYLAMRLGQAGRDAPAFTPSGMTALHALTDGIPRRLDRLAGLTLRAAALERIDRIGEEIVEGIAASESRGTPMISGLLSRISAA